MRLAERVIGFPGAARWCALVVTLVVSARVASAQARPTYHPPHYPTPTEKLPATLPEAAFHPVALTGALLTADPAIGHANRLAVQGRLLWVGDQSGDPYLHVIDRPTGVVRMSFARTGEGPGDFHDVTQFSRRPGDTAGIWVYDLDLRRMTRIAASHDPGATTRVIGGPGVVRINGTKVLAAIRMLWLSRTRLLYIGFTDSNRIMLADTTGAVVAVTSGPLVGSADVTKEVREAESTGVLVCARPSGDRFAIAYTSASRIDLFSGSGVRLASAKVPLPADSEGDFYRDSHGAWHNPAPRYYYDGCAATPTRLYALFAGRLASAGPAGTKMWDAEFVHVFDWAGKLLAVLQLDRLAEAIAVAGDSVLYAGGEAMDGIYQYRLPPLGPPGG